MKKEGQTRSRCVNIPLKLLWLLKQPAVSPTLLDSKARPQSTEEKEKSSDVRLRQGTVLLGIELNNGKDCISAHVLLVLIQCSKPGFAVLHTDTSKKVFFLCNI